MSVACSDILLALKQQQKIDLDQFSSERYVSMHLRPESAKV